VTLPQSPGTTLYEMIGGAPIFDKLVRHFYSYVEQDPVLRPLFPENFDAVSERQYWFLTQLFGGPLLYQQNRGQPKLKLRHQEFPITAQHVEAWLVCMDLALTDAGIQGPAREFMFDRLTKTAHHMMNTPPDDLRAFSNTRE
jgi:hemoglobin